MDETKKRKKGVTAAVAVVLAAAIALGGTFAWQGISQDTTAERENYINPGGRLHYDLSGWQATAHNGGVLTEDVYVENFGTQNIYARVRLDEYMEIGDGAGLMPGDADYNGMSAEPLVAGAAIDDNTTWTTHIPDATDLGLESGNAGGTSTDFHTYWDWVLGGEDTTNNPEGKTVYMPTFNKNGNSLAADVNGTMEGGSDRAQVQYDDWVNYKVGDTATRVRSTDPSIPDGAFYAIEGADYSDTDEPKGEYGNSGVEGTNYYVSEETHTAKETLPGGVCTMAEWKDMSEKQKAAHGWWVYDTDGWAYWSQPIAPDTATGLLLDKVSPTDALNNLGEKWYYAIHAVGQFVTADDLGRKNNTGFYTDPNQAPSEDAKELLREIGVNVAKVDGYVRVTVTIDEGTGNMGERVESVPDVAGIPLEAKAYVNGELADVGEPDLAWSVSGNRSGDTRIHQDTNEFGTLSTYLIIGADEPAGSVLTVTARVTKEKYDGLAGSATVQVVEEETSVKINEDSGTAVIQGSSISFYVDYIGRGGSWWTPDDWYSVTWTLSGAQDRTTVLSIGEQTGQTVSGASDVTVITGASETGPLTLTARYTGKEDVAGKTDQVTIQVTQGETVGLYRNGSYSVEYRDDERLDYNLYHRDAAKLAPGGSILYQAVVKRDNESGEADDLTHEGLAREGWSWSWTSSNPLISVAPEEDADGVDDRGVVTVSKSARIGDTAVITATASNPGCSYTLTGWFAVEVTSLSEEVNDAKSRRDEVISLDGIDWIMTGTDTYIQNAETGKNHVSALLYSRDVLESVQYNAAGAANWNASDVQSYLNSTEAGGWLNGKSEVLARAIPYSVSTRNATMTGYNTSVDKVFLFSEADVFNSVGGERDAALLADYTNGVWFAPGYPMEYSHVLLKVSNGVDTGTPAKWLLRSPYDSSHMACVNTDGTLTTAAFDEECGLRPFFFFDIAEVPTITTGDGTFVSNDGNDKGDHVVTITKGDTITLQASLTTGEDAWVWDIPGLEVVSLVGGSTIYDGEITLKALSAGSTWISVSRYDGLADARFLLNVVEPEVVVTPWTAMLDKGDSTTFAATVSLEGEEIADAAVTWSISSGTEQALASGTTINKNTGKLTVSANEPYGAVILVTANYAKTDTASTVEVTVLPDVAADFAANSAAGRTTTVTLDGIEYYVLDVHEGGQLALVLAKELQATMKFNVNATETDYESYRLWNDSSVSAYLNDGSEDWDGNGNAGWLYGKDETQAMLNSLGGYYSWNGVDQFDDSGYPVFLLTEADVFGTTGGNPASDPNYDDYSNFKGQISADLVGGSWNIGSGWWLRNAKTNVTVASVGPDGSSSYGFAYQEYGVRPAMWISIAYTPE